MNDILAADGLELRLTAGERSIAALREISFRLGEGRVLGLVGESGAGKSMIGRLVSGLLPPAFQVTAGRLLFQGRNLLDERPAARRALLGDRIAFIPQAPLSALNPVRTIGRLFGEHLKRLRVPREERRERAVSALAELRLPDPERLLDRYSFELSGGMCQRVLIAMAFASDPALVIADEPTTALDTTTQAQVVTMMRRLQEAHGTAMLFITHDLRLASRVCDDILVLYAGDILESGPADAIFRRPRHPYTRALQRSNPSLTGPVEDIRPLPDVMPGLSRLADLPGCRLGTRCPVADPCCLASVPRLVEVGPGHVIRAAGRCAEMREHMPSNRLARGDLRAIGEVVFRAEGVGKTFNSGRGLLRRKTRIEALHDVDLTVREGEFVGIVGESGSGKSTLARLAVGLEEPSRGTLELFGQPIEPGKRSTDMTAAQLVFQNSQSALNPRRTVRSLILQGTEARPERIEQGEQLAARLRDILDETGLSGDLLDRLPNQISGGQRQRVNIARALCVAPRLLVADEIVSGLDVSVQAQILNLLLELRAKQNIAILFVSHDLSAVRYLCTRVIVMFRGRLVESGPTEEVFARPRHAYTRALIDAVPPDDPDAPWDPLEKVAAFAELG